MSIETIQHFGAFFEMYCCAILQSQGFEVETHPDMGGEKTKHPDFLVARNGSALFYLECTTAGCTEGQSAAQSRLNDLLDYVDQEPFPQFYLGVEAHKLPERPLRLRSIRQRLESWLSRLNPDAVQRVIEDDALPELTIREQGCHLTFLALPKPPEARDKHRWRNVGMMVSGRWADGRRSILNSLEAKAKRYGALKLPYVIAVNAVDEFADSKDIEEAILGQERPGRDSLTGETRLGRMRDGLWLSPNGPRYRRVSAVLAVEHLDCWQVAARNPILWHNPYATMPISADLWLARQMIPVPAIRAMKVSTGRRMSELLGLHPMWPEDSR